MTDVDLDEFNLLCYNTEQSRSKFRHLIIKLKHPNATILLYRNGKFILTGIKDYKEIDKAVDKFYEKLLNNGVFFIARSWDLVNITVTGTEQMFISLFQFKKNNPKSVDYEPEIFPACVYTFPGTKTKALIFKSGKYIITGIKNFNDINSLNTQFINVIQNYKRK